MYSIVFLILCCGCAPYLSVDPPPKPKTVKPEPTQPARPTDERTGLNLSVRDSSRSWERFERKNRLTGVVESLWLQSPDFYPAEDPMVDGSYNPWPPVENTGHFSVYCDGLVLFTATAVSQIPTEAEYAAYFRKWKLSPIEQYHATLRDLQHVVENLFVPLYPVQFSLGTEEADPWEGGVLFRSEDESWMDKNRFIGVVVESEDRMKRAIYRIRMTDEDRETVRTLKAEHCGTG